MSLARPLESRFSVRARSRTRLTSIGPSGPSIDTVEAANPSFSTLRISISSAIISYPAKAPNPASISKRNDSGSTESNSFRTEGRSCRHFFPKALRLGASSTLWKRSKSFSVSNNSTFNSSAKIS